MPTPNHTPSPSPITPDSVKERLFDEQSRLADLLYQAEQALEDAKTAFQDFKQAVRNGEAEHTAFGFHTYGWSDNRSLPNGDTVCVERGEDYELTPDSIASDLLALEAQGVSVKGLLADYLKERSDYEASCREHSDF